MGAWILNFLFCMADIYMLHRFFASMFPVRYMGKRRAVLFLGAAGLALLVNMEAATWLNLILLPIICFGFAIAEFCVSLKNGIIYTVVFYAIFASGEVTLEIWYRFLSARLRYEIIAWPAGSGLAFLILDYLIRFGFLLFIEQFTKKLEIKGNQEFSMYLLVVPLSTILILGSFLYIDFPVGFPLQCLMCAGALMLYFSNAAIFMILERFSDMMERVKYEQLCSVKQEMDQEQFHNISLLNEDYRRYLHDVHACMRNIRLLAAKGNDKEVVQIVDEMEGKFETETKIRLYSTSSVLNAILSERRARAEKCGVQMDIFVERFLKVDFISPADMISMFGNLLDNALEAAQQCEENKRAVSVKFFMGNEYMLAVHIENYFKTPALLEKGRLLTTKRDKRVHGFGIGIVRQVAEQYGGSLQLEQTDGRFIADLSLSVYASLQDANFGRKTV